MINKTLKNSQIQKLVKMALAEDIGSGDITGNLIPATKSVTAYILSREAATICGTKFVDLVFASLDKKIKIEWLVADGALVKPNQILCWLEGPARSLLTGERTAINFLQTLSGTATITSQFVKKIASTKTKLLDTRKTIPLLRMAQKYAVTCGGGQNHRLGLYDAFLIKENHLAAFNNSVHLAILAARKKDPKKIIEVEVENLQDLKKALQAKADIIMLDNFDLRKIKQAVEINKQAQNPAKLEVSGDINLNNILKVAKTNVDYISVGALTKNIKAVNLSMLVEK